MYDRRFLIFVLVSLCAAQEKVNPNCRVWRTKGARFAASIPPQSIFQ